MTHKQKRILFTWLEKQGALKKYRVNRFKLTTPNDLPWRAYKCLPIEEAIMDAFNWGQTPEGSGYWVSLHVSWLHYLINNDTQTETDIF
jgi:hypothetical protein